MSQVLDMSLDVQVHKDRVVLLCNGIGQAMSWGGGLALYDAVKRLAEFSRAYAQHKDHSQVVAEREKIGDLELIRTGLAFMFVINGMKWFECPWQVAIQIAQVVCQKARELEEIAKHQQVISDQALLLRTPLGRKLGLTNNKRIQKEAWKAAEDIHIPGGVEPVAVVGTPTIKLDPPPQPVEV